jgi:hypothetical protein
MKKIVSILLILCLCFSATLAGAKTVYTDIPFNGQGNSKVFLTYGESDTDYVDFVDYSSSYGLVDACITNESVYLPFAICLSPNGIIGDSSLVLDEKGNWNLYGIPFHLATDEKVIKLFGFKENTSSMGDVQKAVLDGMRNFQMKVEPKAYSRIYLLACNSYGYAPIKVQVTYKDSTVEEKVVNILANPYEIDWNWPARRRYELGYTVLKSAKGTATISSTNGRKFYPYAITLDPNKELERLDFDMGGGHRFINIISITGVEPDVDDIAKYAESFEEITESNFKDAMLYAEQSKKFGAEAESIKALEEKVKAYKEANNIEEETTVPETKEEPIVEEKPVVKGEMQFEDLASVSWAVDAIKYLYDNDIVSGTSDTTFSPNEQLTREQFVKIICGAFDIKESTDAATFKDVAKGSWYEPFVKKACSAGLVSGVSKDKFGVGEKITRQDLAVIIFRAVGDKIKAENRAPDFKDKTQISGYAVEAVTTLARAGILNGTDGKVNPQNYCTRAEMAKIIYGVILNIGEGVK